MQIVIDIPNYVIDDMKECGFIPEEDNEELCKAIDNGTPLPKRYEEIQDVLVEVSDFIECVKNPNDSTEYSILSRISSLIDGILE